MRGASQVIETFHLAFLTVLRTRVDPERYVLKGGANLRYFFGSVRYSEDIDLDVTAVPQWSLEDKVDAVIAGKPMELLLRGAGIRIGMDGVSKPKQTDTTRRWRLPLLTDDHRDPIRTKIEFSARQSDSRHRVDAVPDRIVERHGLAPPLIPHYLGEAAVEQKIRALAGRSETQARDVFDLDLLLRRHASAPGALDAKTFRDAAERGLELPLEAFEGQILPFLEPAAAELHDRGTWELMQLRVAEKLTAAARHGTDAND